TARWVVWRRAAAAGGAGAPWRLALLPAGQRIIEPGADRTLVVLAVGRTGLLSAPATLDLP
ncbi:MAG: hypothetical protein KGI90_16055, partial [Burkholderiales bacterium]|nr:hypothetical protein [Burkholderiales bacterium]